MTNEHVTHLIKVREHAVHVAVNAINIFPDDDALIRYLFDNDGIDDVYFDRPDLAAVERDEATTDYEIELWMVAANQCNRVGLWHRLADIQAHGL